MHRLLEQQPTCTQHPRVRKGARGEGSGARGGSIAQGDDGGPAPCWAAPRVPSPTCTRYTAPSWPQLNMKLEVGPGLGHCPCLALHNPRPPYHAACQNFSLVMGGWVSPELRVWGSAGTRTQGYSDSASFPPLDTHTHHALTRNTHTHSHSHTHTHSLDPWLNH